MKISIITVSYNSAQTIADTVQSVANQTYSDIEHLIIDGNSIDATIDMVKANCHPNVKIISEPDKGIYDAMNKGLNHASGEIIGFLNSDDFFPESTVLEKVFAAFEDSSVEACYADLLYVTPDKSQIIRYWRSKRFSNGDFAKGWSPAHPTFYIRRSALERLGLFNLDFKLAADAEFMMRYLECGNVKSVYIPSILVHMRLGGATNESWRNIVKQNKEIFLALKNNNISFSVFKFLGCKIVKRISEYILARLSISKK